MLTWLPGDTPRDLELVIQSALASVGEHEIPFGSNRGAWIDGVVQAAGSPLGSPWCGCAVRAWWTAGDFEVPPGAGEADAWRRWAIAHGRWSAFPTIGAVVCYHDRTDMLGIVRHVGLVVCVAPVLTIEGNTSLDGYSNDGEVVTLKYDPPHAARIAGYVTPPSSA